MEKKHTAIGPKVGALKYPLMSAALAQHVLEYIMVHVKPEHRAAAIASLFDEALSAAATKSESV